MNVFRHFPVFFALFGGSLGAQPSVVTPPQGYITWTLTTNATSLFGVPLSDTPEALGVAAAVGQDTLQVAGTPWTEGQFSGSPRFVHFLSGSQEGRFLPLVSNTANTLALETGPRPLNGAGFAAAAGDRFEIVRAETLGTLFGETDAELTLQAGATSGAADLVAFFDGQQWEEYFFRSTLGWRRVEQPDIAISLEPIPPSSPIRITRRGPSKNLILTGRVPTTRALLPVTAATTPLGWPFPIDSPLAGLMLGGPDQWKRAATAPEADWLSLPGNGGTFFQLNNGTWTAAPGSPVNGTANVALAAGGAFYAAKQGAATGMHAIELPYDPSAPTSPEPSPTPTPRPPAAEQAVSLPPLLQVTSKKSFRTRSDRATIRGTATARGADIARVQYKSGSKFRNASGTTQWNARVKLKEGRNVFQVRAVDNQGRTSSLVKVIITYTR